MKMKIACPKVEILFIVLKYIFCIRRYLTYSVFNEKQFLFCIFKIHIPYTYDLFSTCGHKFNIYNDIYVYSNEKNNKLTRFRYVCMYVYKIKSN